MNDKRQNNSDWQRKRRESLNMTTMLCTLGIVTASMLADAYVGLGFSLFFLVCIATAFYQYGTASNKEEHPVGMTPVAENFKRANERSPVVEGYSLSPNGGAGARYILADGSVWQLSVADLMSLPEGYPKWKETL